ncbi:MAG: hypothetical protein ABIO39_04255 [Caulobacteraceae bacterium]
MVHRRGFIQAGLALGALPQVGRAADRLQLHGFVFDARFPEAAQVAAAVRGAPRWATAGDMMPLWYERLDLQWKRQPLPLAGVTTADALFVLETLAADRQMRVVYRGVHGAPRDGWIAHELNGPRALVMAAGPVGADWAPRLGRAMTRATPGRSARSAARFVSSAAGSAGRETALYSWIIAPREVMSTV